MLCKYADLQELVCSLVAGGGWRGGGDAALRDITQVRSHCSGCCSVDWSLGAALLQLPRILHVDVSSAAVNLWI